MIAGSWGSEADILITDGVGAFAWQSPGPGAAYTTFDFDNSQAMNGDFVGGIDPGSNTWDVEFHDTFDDGAGEDSESSNVMMTFEEVAPILDPNGSFALGNLAFPNSVQSEGEFAVASVYDTYSITLTTQGEITIATSSPNARGGGFVGADADTEIAIFDNGGVLLMQNDDNPAPGDTYSEITGLMLAAGDYTIVVAPFNSVFADGPTVTPGGSLGDYLLDVSLPVLPVELMTFSIE